NRRRNARRRQRVRSSGRRRRRLDLRRLRRLRRLRIDGRFLAAGVFPIRQQDQVPPEGRLDRLRDLADLEGEGRLGERLLHLVARAEPPHVAAEELRGDVLGLLPRDGGERLLVATLGQDGLPQRVGLILRADTDGARPPLPPRGGPPGRRPTRACEGGHTRG